jgi:rhodanese-related sulfurtransferase
VRSLAAAEAARAAGFPNVYNIADGFEGPPDGAGHRGATSGWKAEGLPWRQK